MNRFANNPRYRLNNIPNTAETPEDRMAQKLAEKKMREQQMFGGIASVGLPILGAAAGGLIGGLTTLPAGGAGAIPGMEAGGKLGQAGGEAAGQYFYNQGEQAMDPVRQREMERMAKKQALMQAIMSMPR
jgi:hypothetical protein